MQDTDGLKFTIRRKWGLNDMALDLRTAVLITVPRANEVDWATAATFSPRMTLMATARNGKRISECVDPLQEDGYRFQEQIQ